MALSWSGTMRMNGRGRTVAWAARSPFAQGLVLVAALAGLIVAVPIVLIGGAAFILYVLARVAAGRVRALRGPNGPLDGRRNVRVRMGPPAEAGDEPRA